MVDNFQVTLKFISPTIFHLSEYRGFEHSVTEGLNFSYNCYAQLAQRNKFNDRKDNKAYFIDLCEIIAMKKRSVPFFNILLI